MKRIIPALLYMVFLIYGICMLSGCQDTQPIVFHSVLTVNTDESGQREITATVQKSTIRSLFGGKNIDFKSFIESYCPDFIDWQCAVETTDSYELVFSIPFSGLDEYQSLVSELSGIPDCVTVSRPQVGVKTGFTLTENTDIVSLFSWFSKALDDRTSAGTSKIRSLLQNGSNSFVYAGREYEQKGTGLYAYVETLLDAVQVDILTGLALEDDWSRIVRIQFPEELLENAANVKPYLTSLLPDGITENWEDSVVWTLTFPESDPDTLGELMNGLFQSQNEERLSEQVTGDTPMHITHDYTEPLNLSFFVPTKGETNVRYFIKDTSKATLLAFDESGEASAFPEVSDDYDGYVCIFSRSMSSGNLHFSASYQYQPIEIAVDTHILSAQDIRQSITLEMGSAIPKLHRSLMVQAFKKNIGHSSSLTEETDENELYRIRYTSSGSVKTVTDSFRSVFGSNLVLSYDRATPFTWKPAAASSYQHTADFTELLAVPSQTLITAVLRFPSGDSAEQGEKTLTHLSTNGTVQMSGTVSRTNYLYFVLCAFGGLAGLFLLYLILTNSVTGLHRDRRKKKRRPKSRRRPKKG